MDPNDLFDDLIENQTTEPKPSSGDLPEPLARQAELAARTHDLLAAAAAALESEEERIRAEAAPRLSSLKTGLLEAQAAHEESLRALEDLMSKHEITTIPMVDRPSITLKVTKGKKGNVTKKWLTDEKNVTVRTYDTVLRRLRDAEEKLAERGAAIPDEPLPFGSGKDAANGIWDAVPTGKDKRSVVIPDPYEDEPGA